MTEFVEIPGRGHALTIDSGWREVSDTALNFVRRFALRKNGDVSRPAVALLYDIHGNLPALESVLAEAESAGSTRCVLGGDYASMGPWPRETAELVEGLPAVARIRGNVDRWLVEKPEAPESAQHFLGVALTAAREALGAELVARLYDLPASAELDGMLVCHGSPLSDIESFAPQAQGGEERMLATVRSNGRSCSAIATFSSGVQDRTGRTS